MENFYNLTRDDLKKHLSLHGFKSFNADQVFDWVYRKSNLDIEQWSNLSKSLRNHILESFHFDLPTIIFDVLSKDGTRKFLVKFHDAQTVESVLIQSGDRLTLCISSQVGCAIGCNFCHTATQGLKRNLKSGEILGQYLAVTHWLRENVDPQTRITNIVYMGQGEPLHNFKEVKSATLNFLDPWCMGLSQRKVTLSTSGLAPKIEKLDDFPPVNVAISLHSAFDDKRTGLMPINKTFDIQRLFKAIRSIPLKAHRRITYEYLLIRGLNDKKEDIDGLIDLLNKKESKVNIIPFNEFPGSEFKRPTDQHILWFMGELNKRGLTTTVRATKGQDILAACGQLKTQYEKVNLWNNDIEIRMIPSQVQLTKT